MRRGAALALALGLTVALAAGTGWLARSVTAQTSRPSRTTGSPRRPRGAASA